ncbi:hypothetical protein M9458_025605, partial [Cirrhinus mrigala]
AELKKRWQLFISSNQFEVHNCFADIHPKHLPRQTTEQSESNEEGSHAPTQGHQPQVAVQSAEDVIILHEEEPLQQRRRNDFRRDDGGDHRGE